MGEFVDPNSYKSYGELQKKLYEVIGESVVQSTLSTAEQVELDEVVEPPSVEPVVESKPQEEGDDAMSFFAKLAQED